ncbi:MAG: zinc ribbon domain-containing protein [Burkholderiaceae bacterium]|nr:zinc ribbon domain-containing protein [Burkholderiaceae bacterium]MDP3825574.1 zinc ribbon domain-containing protein [Polaromonas sp.]
MPPSNYGGQPPAPSGTARAKCGAFVTTGVRFCPQCGAGQIAIKCAACGADAPAGAKFCPGCGKSVPS